MDSLGPSLDIFWQTNEYFTFSSVTYRILHHGHNPSWGTKHSCPGDGGFHQLPSCPLNEEEVLPDGRLDGGLARKVSLWWDDV